MKVLWKSITGVSYYLFVPASRHPNAAGAVPDTATRKNARLYTEALLQTLERDRDVVRATVRGRTIVFINKDAPGKIEGARPDGFWKTITGKLCLTGVHQADVEADFEYWNEARRAFTEALMPPEQKSAEKALDAVMSPLAELKKAAAAAGLTALSVSPATSPSPREPSHAAPHATARAVAATEPALKQPQAVAKQSVSLPALSSMVAGVSQTTAASSQAAAKTSPEIAPAPAAALVPGVQLQMQQMQLQIQQQMQQIQMMQQQMMQMQSMQLQAQQLQMQKQAQLQQQQHQHQHQSQQGSPRGVQMAQRMQAAPPPILPLPSFEGSPVFGMRHSPTAL